MKKHKKGIDGLNGRKDGIIWVNYGQYILTLIVIAIINQQQQQWFILRILSKAIRLFRRKRARTTLRPLSLPQHPHVSSLLPSLRHGEHLRQSRSQILQPIDGQILKSLPHSKRVLRSTSSVNWNKSQKRILVSITRTVGRHHHEAMTWARVAYTHHDMYQWHKLYWKASVYFTCSII